MGKKYLRFILVFVLLLGPVMAALDAYAEGHESLSEAALTATISIDDATLETEAVQLGVSASQVERYVAKMKSINQGYQNGALTRTEYVGAKRELIENLK